ncbi:fibrillin-1-like isoform X2 [Dreissena polymorpha]|uniref:Uncharacterized protein n=1 Tax=Dreissena polymorpha TaxID=45954 RepID=A0A9D4K5B7_DREPO|nr:fibrillin-1-like isoform X2 [Dreissena polymorpha]KAH3833313.1 hypothetical protein DPMN_106619 [Dreissena polymorpha]
MDAKSTIWMCYKRFIFLGFIAVSKNLVLATDGSTGDPENLYTDISTDVSFTNDSGFREESPCREPHAPTNGSVHVWGGGYLLEYSCDEGLYPLGAIFASCDPETKQWTAKRPLCVSLECEPPSPLENGHLHFLQRGAIVIATCRSGFNLIGSRSRHCNGHSWQGFTPRCRERFPSLGLRRQAYEKDETLTTTATPAQLAAKKLQQDIEKTDNTCYLRFTEPPKVEHAVVTANYMFNRIRSQWVLLANYTCNPGYNLADPYVNYFYCKDYKWHANKTPECVADLEKANSCLANNGWCSHICVPHRGGRYHCDCPSGFTLGRFRKICYDINECEVNNGGCEQICVNLEASFFCTCQPGYVASGNQCLDIDECKSEGLDLGCDGTCVNVPGSFECDCVNVTGYTLSDDKTYCVDADECLLDNGGCEDTCVNTLGSFHCSCRKKGYKLSSDGTTCEDIDECERYSTNRCKHGACVNTEGGYRCKCDPGFTTNDIGAKCIDVDECQADNGGCHELCSNTFGGFECKCKRRGYAIGEDNRTCHDIDECAHNHGGCQESCTNTIGSFYCLCVNGFRELGLDGLSCKPCDRDSFYSVADLRCVRCPDNMFVQDPNNATSASQCVCPNGFALIDNDGITCVDIDECAAKLLPCLHRCHNTFGSAHCACREGFFLYNTTGCVDIDECHEGSEACSQVCLNTDGSFQCACTPGYVLATSGKNCYDIDECLDGVLNCDQECVNTDGSSYCECFNGYALDADRVTCLDIDECNTGNHLCDDVCINTAGSYRCECTIYGLKLSWDKASCVDINECMEGENDCVGTCVNTYGSYTCECDGASPYADHNCKAINECKNPELNSCTQECIKTESSYRCDCYLGHALINFNTCIACDMGFYRDTDSVECVACPPNSVTEGNGSTSLADCTCEEGYMGNISEGEICTLP